MSIASAYERHQTITAPEFMLLAIRFLNKCPYDCIAVDFIVLFFYSLFTTRTHAIFGMSFPGEKAVLTMSIHAYFQH